MKYYLDTNIIIYALKGKYPSIQTHFMRIPPTAIVIPTIVMAEIEYGARRSNNYEETISRYLKFTDIFEKEPFCEKAQSEYGRIRNELEKAGTSVGANDLIIAATVLVGDGILITNNTKEFSRIPGIRLENWTVD